MNDDALLREIRAEVERLGPCSPARRYPAALKARIIAWVSGRRRAGASAAELVKTLGIPWESLSRWSTGPAPVPQQAPPAPPMPAAFRPVRVVAPPAKPRPVLVLRGPRGFTVEGLDIAGLAQLLERLG